MVNQWWFLDAVYRKLLIIKRIGREGAESGNRQENILEG